MILVSVAGRRGQALGYVVARAPEAGDTVPYQVSQRGELAVPLREEELVLDFGNGVRQVVSTLAQLDVVPALRLGDELTPPLLFEPADGDVLLQVWFDPTDVSWYFAALNLISISSARLLSSIPRGYRIARLPKVVRANYHTVQFANRTYLVATHTVYQYRDHLSDQQSFLVRLVPSMEGLLYEDAWRDIPLRVDVKTEDDDDIRRAGCIYARGAAELKPGVITPFYYDTPGGRTWQLVALVEPKDVHYMDDFGFAYATRYIVPRPELARELGLWREGYEEMYHAAERLGRW